MFLFHIISHTIYVHRNQSYDQIIETDNYYYFVFKFYLQSAKILRIIDRALLGSVRSLESVKISFNLQVKLDFVDVVGIDIDEARQKQNKEQGRNQHWSALQPAEI